MTARPLHWSATTGVVTFFLFLLSALPALAADPVTINSLLNDPESYKLKVVRVSGTVIGHRMSHFIGTFTKLEKCVQRFWIKDDTASIAAVYATICPSEAIMLRSGDRVTVEAHFQRAPGTAGMLDVRTVLRD
jgi:hypothetical protein